MPAANPLATRIRSALAERDAQGLYRHRQAIQRLDGGQILVDDRPYHHFCGNDYLGLAESSRLSDAWKRGLRRFGAGSGASPLVTGHHQAHQQLEQTLCQWLGFERALLFSSGFAANQAIIHALMQKSDLLLQDRLNHASLQEAGHLCPATQARFKHNDCDDLARRLQSAAPEQAKLVITEGVFSMDGDRAPLADIAALCQQHRAWLMVDDAHGCGILGQQGRGSCDAAGIQPDLLVVTFGKAFGCAGAAVLCGHDLAEYLTQFARHLIYSTALPPAQACAIGEAIEVITQEPWRQQRLAQWQQLLQARLDSAIPLCHTDTPIQPLMVGDSQRALALSEALRRKGFWVSAIRPPTVPAGKARLRITLSAAHSQHQVQQLADAINEAWHEQ
ncbi:8-amino-7-oxononanoate synthase [Ferrimonas sp. SCSIO 43195]|uniref:8-amino-7-oxononanoate synthase n=1 Tax=Ferrimonas sp. SCSIO 43195 TaxID=2822844 RepID=UPI002075B745|nr:8-amino-7-oxononanoate synthase [Ferrimonas sp. SCSIO 43195]USD36191.1 8-amino-7-oxononanoate synthase [Ferrimonas sp. SCSIO 43195]